MYKGDDNDDNVQHDDKMTMFKMMMVVMNVAKYTGHSCVQDTHPENGQGYGGFESSVM